MPAVHNLGLFTALAAVTCAAKCIFQRRLFLPSLRGEALFTGPAAVTPSMLYAFLFKGIVLVTCAAATFATICIYYLWSLSLSIFPSALFIAFPLVNGAFRCLSHQQLFLPSVLVSVACTAIATVTCSLMH